MLIELFFTMLFSYIFVKLVVAYAHKLGLYDISNERSHHCSVTHSGGAIGFAVALFLVFFSFPILVYFHIYHTTFSISWLFVFIFLYDFYRYKKKIIQRTKSLI